MRNREDDDPSTPLCWIEDDEAVEEALRDVVVSHEGEGDPDDGDGKGAGGGGKGADGAGSRRRRGRAA